MKIRGRERTLGEVVRKSVTFIPKRIYWRYHDAWMQREFARVLAGGADMREKNILRKYLVRTLKRAHSNVPYWSEFDCLKGVNEENVFEKLSQLPLLDKEVIRQQGDRMHIQRDMAGFSKGHTGGTTGRPLEFYYGRADETSHQKALYEYMTGLTYKENLDKAGAIVGFSGTRPRGEDVAQHVYWTEMKPGIYGSLDFCTLYMQAENMPYYIAKLNEIKPIVIRGYSNAILNMAKAVEKDGELEFVPKAIYVTSEHCSLESMKFISKAFSCPVHGQYGQNEACHFAWTKPNEDVYYCSPYYGYVEVVDDKGHHVEAGQMGEMVVTAFGNDVQPFIRYRTGDLVRFGGVKNGVVKIDKVVGRNNAYLINAEGEKIYASGIVDIHYLKSKEKISQFQVEQNEIGKVIFRIVTDGTWTVDDEEEIRKLLAVKKIAVDFAYLDIIPMTGRGKERHIVQNVKDSLTKVLDEVSM